MSKFQSIYIDLYMYVYMYIYIYLWFYMIWQFDMVMFHGKRHQITRGYCQNGCVSKWGVRKPMEGHLHWENDVLNHQIWGHSIFKQIHVQYLFIELFWCFSSSKDNPFTTGCWHLLIPTSELVLGLMPATQGFLKFWIHFFQIPCPKGSQRSHIFIISQSSGLEVQRSQHQKMRTERKNGETWGNKENGDISDRWTMMIMMKCR